jgi:hypothetical protein
MQTAPSKAILAAIPQQRRILVDRLPVKDRSGETISWVKSKAALRMIRDGVAIPVGTKNCIRALRLPPEFDDSKISALADYSGQHYSHHHAAKDNPEGCWTYKQLKRDEAPLYDSVLAESAGWVQLRRACGAIDRWVSREAAEALVAAKRAIPVMEHGARKMWLMAVAS